MCVRWMFGCLVHFCWLCIPLAQLWCAANGCLGGARTPAIRISQNWVGDGDGAWPHPPPCLVGEERLPPTPIPNGVRRLRFFCATHRASRSPWDGPHPLFLAALMGNRMCRLCVSSGGRMQSAVGCGKQSPTGTAPPPTTFCPHLSSPPPPGGIPLVRVEVVHVSAGAYFRGPAPCTLLGPAFCGPTAGIGFEVLVSWSCALLSVQPCICICGRTAHGTAAA